MALPDQQVNEADASPFPVAILAAAILSLVVAVYSLWVGQYGLSGLGLAAATACCLALRMPMRKPVNTVSHLPLELRAEMHRQFEYLQSEIADLAHISNDAATRVTHSFSQLQLYMQALMQARDGDEMTPAASTATVDRQQLENGIKREVNQIIQTMQNDDIVQQIGIRLQQRLLSFEGIITGLLDECARDLSASVDARALQQLRLLDQHAGHRVHDVSGAYLRQQQAGDDGVELF